MARLETTASLKSSYQTVLSDSIDMAGCSSQLIQAPLDCEQSSRVHNSRCFSKDISKDRF